MTGWREKRREARWKRKARMRNLERINKNKKCLAAKIIWICSRLPWRRELRITPDWKWKQRKTVAFREGVSWEDSTVEQDLDRIVAFREGVSWEFQHDVIINPQNRRLPWRRELRNAINVGDGLLWFWSPSVKAWVEKFLTGWLPVRTGSRLPWRRELRKSQPGRSLHKDVAFREGVSWEASEDFFVLGDYCRLPWRRELRILAFRPYKCAVIERL